MLSSADGNCKICKWLFKYDVTFTEVFGQTEGEASNYITEVNNFAKENKISFGIDYHHVN